MKQLSRQIAGNGANLQRVVAIAERLEHDGLGNEYTDVCYAFENGARALPADDQKKLALELVRLRRDVYQYGKVCTQILHATSWPLEELERFFDASAKPSYRPGEPSYRDVGRSFWQYCAQAFFLQLERLSDHERFPQLLHRFVVDVWSFVFAGDAPSVPKVLRLLRQYPETGRSLFEAIEAREQERLQFIARFDLARVERSLRQDLSCQIWDMLHRDHFRVADDDGVYHRALEAIAFPGQMEYIVQRREEARRNATSFSASYNLFNGEPFPDGRWVEPEDYLAQLRSLGEEPEKDFLSRFDAAWLHKEFWRIESPHAPASSLQWVGAWNTFGHQLEPTIEVLAVLASLPDKKPKSAQPPGEWWQNWQQAIAALDPGVVRELCMELPLPGRESEVSWWGDTLADLIVRAATWGLVPVATVETCDYLARGVVVWELANSLIAVEALACIGTPQALNHLHVLSQRTKNKTVLRALEKETAKLAATQGLDTETFNDRAESYGLDSQGRRTWTLGEFQVVLELAADGRIETHFFNDRTGKPVAALPKATKETAQPVLLEVRETTKGLRAGYAMQKGRLEQVLVNRRTWDLRIWQESAEANPIFGNLAGRLIWQVEQADGCILAQPAGRERWVNVEGEPVVVAPDAKLTLMHPALLPPDVLAAWQRHVVQHRIVQPFKQAFRETYVLTPPEERTETYSNRFAGQVVSHKALYALLKERGWSGMGYLGEGETPAHRHYPQAHLRAVLENADSSIERDESFVTLDRVWFAPLARGQGRWLERATPVPLRDVPPVVFSEAMRDVDLFVGVTGRGADPNWEDWEVRRQRDAALWTTQRQLYEQQQSATADQRAALLRELLPTLGLGDRVKFEGRFALVRGQLHTYRVHLGSGNIHIEPSGRYLCIVPARRKDTVYLPFEESDLKTTEIISKILLLAADDQIADPTIRGQL